ncbi:Crp/Fnr family transcriptional regulator [Sphingomonas sp.]|uniref:Crp/Fnr family transcriptional regulator n=1 Tax=Sphingomonas sp. TaxID=28214 RepID=UPI002DD6A932|nr:Crp/Fnr family transcriptional regulator [Sphingomonas sp.]
MTARFLAGLSAGVADDILAAATERTFAKGTALFREEDSADQLVLIVAGSVRVWRTSPRGSAITLHRLGPGDLPGCTAVIRRTPYPATATAQSPARVLMWPAERIRGLFAAHPRLAANLLDSVAARNEELLQRLHEVSTLGVGPRVARTLVRATIADKTDEIALSRQEIAELTATTLHTVSRLLSRWHRGGIVAAGRGRVTIVDRTRLAAIGEG